MESKQKLSFKELRRCHKVNRIFTGIVFVTVFIFTFCWIDENLRSGTPMIIFLSVFLGLILIEIILWIALFFGFKNKDKTQNEKNVDKALKELKDEDKKEH